MILVWTGLAIAAAALIWMAAVAGPLRRFFKLREDVRAHLHDFAPVLAAAKDEGGALLAEAQQTFHDLGTRMSGFAGRELATLKLRRSGFDPASAASGLTGLANALPAYGIERLRWRAQVERALNLRDVRMERSRLNPLLIALALAAIAFAGWTYTANWKLRHALRTAHIVRVSIEKETQRTHERAADAETARLAAEQSLTEVHAQLAAARKRQTAVRRSLADANAQLTLTRKAKVAAEQSLEQTKEQLAAAEGARKTAQDQVKALGEEVAALKGAKEGAERSLRAANDELAQIKAAKAESDAAAVKAKEDLEQEKKARAAAEQTPHAPPPATP